MRNLIRAHWWRTKYCDEPHLVIAIDNIALDELVAEANECPNMVGLIPAWLEDLYDARERSVVWSRIQPETPSRVILPVLMCSDDLDFSCTVVVADMTYDKETVTWHGLGFGTMEFDQPPSAIAPTGWFPGLGPFSFSRADYDCCVESFRTNLKASGL